jgi:long-chain fatty acid transport protein
MLYLSIYANPASMGLATQHQIAGNFSLLLYRTKFTGMASIPRLEADDDDGSDADDEGIIFYANQITGSAKSRKNQFIPTIGIISNAHKDLKVGIIIHSPFGGRTTFGQDSVLKGHIIRTKLKTVNITPSISYSPFDMLSMGAGLQLQHLELSHSRRFMISDGGLLAKLSPRWNVGFSYQSEMAGKAKAYTNLIPPNEYLANGYSTFMTQSTVYFPSKFNLNTSIGLDNAWTLFADMSFTNWNKKKGISIVSVDGNVNYNDNFNLDWHNAFATGLGASIKINELFSLRLGSIHF